MSICRFVSNKSSCCVVIGSWPLYDMVYGFSSHAWFVWFVAILRLLRMHRRNLATGCKDGCKKRNRAVGVKTKGSAKNVSFCLFENCSHQGFTRVFAFLPICCHRVPSLAGNSVHKLATRKHRVLGLIVNQLQFWRSFTT